MAKRLTGLNPLAYMGVEPLAPTDTITVTFDPTVNDFQGINVGDTWINTAAQRIWVFLGLDTSKQAIWIETATAAGVGASQFVTDSGTASATGSGFINVVGGSNVNTDGNTLNTVIINLDNSPSVSGSLTAGTGISSTTGNIVAVAGNIDATVGSMTAGTTVTGGTGVIATTGDVTITAGNLNLPNTNGSGTEGVININSFPAFHEFTGGGGGGVNTFVGSQAGNFTNTANGDIVVGQLAGAALTTGSRNVLMGLECGELLTTGGDNTLLGYTAGLSITTGSSNIIIGSGSGGNYTSSESSNILIDNNGVVAESNIIRIGNLQTKCFIAGIRGVTTDVNDAVPVLVDSAGQLGVTSSSRVYKDNIVSMRDDSLGLMSLRPVTFEYKSDVRKTKQYGFIAEEVAEVYPDLVVYNQEGKPETVKYHVMPAIIINELQRLNERINEIQSNCTCGGSD